MIFGKKCQAPKTDSQKSLLLAAILGLFDMGLDEQNIYELRMWFEEALNRTPKKVEKQKKYECEEKYEMKFFCY